MYAAHNGAIYPSGEITMKKGHSIEILLAAPKGSLRGAAFPDRFSIDRVFAIIISVRVYAFAVIYDDSFRPFRTRPRQRISMASKAPNAALRSYSFLSASETAFDYRIPRVYILHLCLFNWHCQRISNARHLCHFHSDALQTLINKVVAHFSTSAVTNQQKMWKKYSHLMSSFFWWSAKSNHGSRVL